MEILYVDCLLGGEVTGHYEIHPKIWPNYIQYFKKNLDFTEIAGDFNFSLP